MTFNDQDIAAIQTLGYTPDEARFLYLVAVHSGYFVPRQFLTFSGAKWGKRSNNFVGKLESRGHVTWREYDRTGGVYHLFSKNSVSLHRQGESPQSPAALASSSSARVSLLLDFVLANLGFDYLETEPEKVAFFCDTLGVPRKILPAKTYEGGPRSEPTLRYFVDKFPLFLDTTRLLFFACGHLLLRRSRPGQPRWICQPSARLPAAPAPARNILLPLYSEFPSPFRRRPSNAFLARSRTPSRPTFRAKSCATSGCATPGI